MTSFWPFVGLLGLFPLTACSGAEGSPQSPLEAPLAAVTTWPRAEVERDLGLTLQPGREPLRQTLEPHLRVVLSNHSRDRTYAVVNSNDGSESGWREPHAWFELAVRGAGEAFHAPPEITSLRCGNYAEEWQKDVVSLQPGAALELGWTNFPFDSELDDATEVQVIAHYSYGEQTKDLHTLPLPLHAMPAYALQSAPLTLTIDRPLALQVEVHGPLPTGPSQPLGSVISVTATNVSRHPVLFGGVGATALTLEVDDGDGQPGSGEILLQGAEVAQDEQTPLLPGQSRSVLSAGATTANYWQADPEQPLRRIRALFFLDSTGEGFFKTISAWVDSR